MLPVYAQPSDLTAAPWFLTIQDQDAQRFISYASRLVRAATKTAIYTADFSTGLPVDGGLRDALRDATIAQVASWSALAIDPAKGAADGGRTASSKSLGSASIQYSSYASSIEARARVATALSADAISILQDAGLVGQSPVVWG